MRRLVVLGLVMAGMSGCNGKPIGEREGKAMAPPPHARSKEIRALCGEIEKAESPLCKGIPGKGAPKVPAKAKQG